MVSAKLALVYVIGLEYCKPRPRQVRPSPARTDIYPVQFHPACSPQSQPAPLGIMWSWRPAMDLELYTRPTRPACLSDPSLVPDRHHIRPRRRTGPLCIRGRTVERVCVSVCLSGALRVGYDTHRYQIRYTGS